MDDTNSTPVQYDFETYLAQAMINAIIAADGLPYLQVRTENISGFIPPNYLEEGLIVLNVGAKALANLSLHDGTASMTCRFSGRSSHLTFPTADIIAVFDHNTGVGRVVGDPNRPVVKGRPTTERRPLIRPGQIGAVQDEPSNQEDQEAPVEQTVGNVIHRDFGKNNKKKD